jgi:hypothetical protein
LLEFGTVTNITNPLNISNVSLSLMPLSISISGVSVPIRTNLATLLVTQKMSFSTMNVTLNYSILYDSYLVTQKFYEPAVAIFKCEEWANNSCNSQWSKMTSQVDTIHHLVSASSNSTSLFFAAEPEVCGNGVCGSGESCVSCPTDCGQCSSGANNNPVYTGSGGSGGAPATTPAATEEVKFSLRTNLTNAQMDVNQTGLYAIWILNQGTKIMNFSVSIGGSLTKMLSLEKNSLAVDGGNESIVLVSASTYGFSSGSYSGDISVSSGGKTQSLPITLQISLRSLAELDATVEAISKQVAADGTARFRIMLYNLGQKKNFNANITYSISEAGGGGTIFSKSEIRPMDSSYEAYVEEIPIPPKTPLGSYLFTTEIAYEGKKKSSSDIFEIIQPFWTQQKIQAATVFLVVGILIFSVWYGRSRYIRWKSSKARYIFPVKMNKLPKGDLWLGKVAETDAKATFDIADLTTHVLVAGATGSGKSVSGSIFAEELLEKKIPIVVFDPTAQWTGFVRPCTDQNVLKYYKHFGMTENDTKPFKGMIYEVSDPKLSIDFKKYMNPGEITVFTLNKLEPGEYDEAVTNIINTIFKQNWEESTKVKLIIIFDEVHRLLEKYGGKGGYVALERACREFRKWGIGLIMVSQVLSDFKEAIKGNVLTEVQLHTKSLADLSRIEKKYGLRYTKGVAKEEVGVGMIQNPKYNEGIPWFISFRPPMHMPHKILDAEMKSYKEFSKDIEDIEVQLVKIEAAGENIFDMKTELKLAKDKLKEGRFRMAEIYITSLKKKLAGGSKERKV